MDGFVKIYGSKLLKSTLWDECWQARLVFVGLLAMADAEGFVDVPSVKPLARLLNLTVEDTEAGLQVLEAPDPDSRTPTEGGRRVLREAAGWQVVNYTKYREYRTAKQEKHRRYMADKRAADAKSTDGAQGSQVNDGADGAAEERRGEAEEKREEAEGEPAPPLTLPGETQGAFLERELTLVLNNGFGTSGFDSTKFTYQAAIRLIQNESATLEQIRDALEGWNAGRRPDEGIKKLSMFQERYWPAVRAACLETDPDEPDWKKELTS